MKNTKAKLMDDESGAYHYADPITDMAMDWLIRIEAQPENANQKAEFERWLAEDHMHASAFSRIATMWDLPELKEATEILAAKHPVGTEDPKVIVFKPRPAKSSKTWMRAVAAIAATVVVAVGVYQYPSLMLQWNADYVTQAGMVRQLTLPDGSQLTLNTNSAVALDFTEGRRNVKLLQGEAYFDVVKDAEHPFVVAAQFSQTEVKGTAFTVRSEDDQDVVVLQRGVVEVSLESSPAVSVELRPGQEVFAERNALSHVQPADVETSLAWLSGRMSFNAEPLEKVVAQVQRYYPHTILIARDSLKSNLVSGNYRLDNPEGILRSLAAATESTVYRIPGGILILN